ncbi:MAG: aminotransferase class I/II-fold pyridoxal phosphate-dependent enzyme [Oscillospiraceae bacterium]|nr:aminotransferase class I/II-fold pyridoxal phosphate-dependent enzyme [Oscillospiraceae bacterium]
MDYENILDKKARDIKPSGIRKFFDIASEMKDVISLSIGEPDFSTPWHVRQAGIQSLDKGKTWYSPNKGFSELRASVCEYFNRRFGVSFDKDTETLITVGGSEAIDLMIRSLIGEGDEVLIPDPSFVAYEPITKIVGGVAVSVPTREEDSFRLTAEDLKSKITPKTKLLILPYPNNPTGAVMRRSHLEAIAEVLRGTNILVLSDEIYGELTYGSERHVSFASIEGMRERTVVVSGFSKAFAMTGWRLGYALGPEPIIAVMTKLHQFAIMCAPTTAQYAAIEAMQNGDDDIEHMRGEYDSRRRLIVDGFRKLGFSCFEPEGAFYIFPCIKHTGLSSDKFCERLLNEKHVAVIPGNAFGESGEGYIRVSYSYSLKHINEALKRIKEFMEEERKR